MYLIYELRELKVLAQKNVLIATKLYVKKFPLKTIFIRNKIDFIYNSQLPKTLHL